MMNKRNLFHRHRGAMLVELAVVLPIILLLVAAFLELSRVWMLKQTADSAAYEGARAGIIAGAQPSDARDAAEALLRAARIKRWTIDCHPTEFVESTGVIRLTVNIPVSTNTWVAPMFFKSTRVTSSVALITERPAAVQLSGLNEATGGLLGINALGIGL